MRVHDKEAVIQKLQELKISPKRSLGQNFLIGPSVIDRIVSAAESLQPQSYVEVGPGLGALTEPLIQANKPLMVIELDKVLSEHWRQRGLNVKEGDALQMNWLELGLRHATLISNLPYQISSSLVIERSICPAGVDGMILMFQKEVAQRIMAAPKTKEYGLLTVIAQSFWNIENVLEAGPNEFYPPPNVASRVLKFRRNTMKLSSELDYLDLVKTGFSQRRKLLLSNLKTVYSKTNTQKAQWEFELVNLGYDHRARAEELSVSDWVKLFLKFY